MFYSYDEKKYVLETESNPITINYTTGAGRGIITLNPARVFPCTVHDVKSIIDTLWISADPYGIAEQIADYMRACVAEIQETRAKYSGPFDAKTRSQLSGLIKKYISNLDKIADAFSFESLTDCEVETMKMKKCEVLCNEVDHSNENGTGRTIKTYSGKTFTKCGIIFQVHQKQKKGARWITLPGTGAAVTSYYGAEKEAPEHIDERIIDILKKNAENDKMQFVRADFVRVCNACGIEPDEIQADFVKPAEQTAEPATASEPIQETETSEEINVVLSAYAKKYNEFYEAQPAGALYGALVDFGIKYVSCELNIPGKTLAQTRRFIKGLLKARNDYFSSDRELAALASVINDIYKENTPETCKPSAPADRPQAAERIATKETRTRAPYYIITRAERPQVWKPCTMTAGAKNVIIYAGNYAKTQTGSRQKTEHAERPKTAFKILGFTNIPLTDKNPTTGAERSHKATLNLTAYANGRPPETWQKSALFALGPRCLTADRRKIKQKSPPEFFKQGVEFTQSSHLKMTKNGTRIFQGGAGYQKFYT